MVSFLMRSGGSWASGWELSESKPVACTLKLLYFVSIKFLPRHKSRGLNPKMQCNRLPLGLNLFQNLLDPGKICQNFGSGFIYPLTNAQQHHQRLQQCQASHQRKDHQTNPTISSPTDAVIDLTSDDDDVIDCRKNDNKVATPLAINKGKFAKLKICL